MAAEQGEPAEPPALGLTGAVLRILEELRRQQTPDMSHVVVGVRRVWRTGVIFIS